MATKGMPSELQHGRLSASPHTSLAHLFQNAFRHAPTNSSSSSNAAAITAKSFNVKQKKPTQSPGRR